MTTTMASASSSRASSSSSHRRRRRSSTNDSQTAVREYVYALSDTSISEWLKCAICLNPFLDPLQAANCEHIFCGKCILKHLDSYTSESGCGAHCPSCRSMLSAKQLKPAPSLIRNMVDSLLVKCPHAKRGCSHTCERSLMDMHAKRDCGWAWIGEYEGEGNGRGRCECGKRVLRRDWQAHLDGDECSVQRVQCPYAQGETGCHQLLKESELEEHQDVCPARPVHCMHCNEELQRRLMDAHEAGCGEAQVCCIFARFGCTWQGRRCEHHEAHLAECRLAPLEAYLVKQEEDVNALRLENKRLGQQMLVMEQEQARMSALVEGCVSSLGTKFLSVPPPASSTVEDEAQGDARLVVPIPSPRHAGRGAASPPVTLRGRSGSTMAVPLAESPLDMHQASTSAPASGADFPWQWPESNAPSSSNHGSAPRSSLSPPSKTVSDALSEINEKLVSVFDQLGQMERRIEDNHVVGLNANFEASRAHEELNSVRHGLHALRISVSCRRARTAGFYHGV